MVKYTNEYISQKYRQVTVSRASNIGERAKHYDSQAALLAALTPSIYTGFKNRRTLSCLKGNRITQDTRNVIWTLFVKGFDYALYVGIIQDNSQLEMNLG